MRAVPGRDVRRDLALGDLARQRADLQLFGGGGELRSAVGFERHCQRAIAAGAGLAPFESRAE